jgi:hypothetical protein
VSIDGKSPIAFISRSNWEHALSGRVLNNSSRSLGGPAGEVGGVVNWFDWIDERDGEEDPLRGLD